MLFHLISQKFCREFPIKYRVSKLLEPVITDLPVGQVHGQVRPGDDGVHGGVHQSELVVLQVHHGPDLVPVELRGRAGGRPALGWYGHTEAVDAASDAGLPGHVLVFITAGGWRTDNTWLAGYLISVLAS